LRGLSITGALLVTAFILCPVIAPISPSSPASAQESTNS